MPKVKNIIIINDFDHINGGISVVAIGSANAMAEAGYRVIYFSAVEDPSRNTLSGKIEQHSTRQPDILTHPSRIKALGQGLWNRKSARMLHTILEKLNPDDTIVHLYGWMKALSPSIGKVLTGSGFSVICSLQEFFTACPNGGFYNYRRNEICHLKAMSLSCICTNCDSRNYGHKVWRVARQAIQSNAGHIPGRIKHFISVTKFSENVIRPYLPPDADIYLVNNPVTHVEPGRPRADVSHGNLLFIGRLSAEKGIFLACEAALAAGVKLTIIGDGPLRSSLQEKYPDVIFKGWLSSSEIFAEMQRAKALVFPSVWYETQGIVVLEALSVGLPVIVSDSCAASEFVDQQNGFTFAGGNVEDLTRKIQLLFNDTSLAETMGQYAYDKYWKAPFLLDNYVRDVLQIYDTILEKDHVSNLNS